MYCFRAPMLNAPVHTIGPLLGDYLLQLCVFLSLTSSSLSIFHHFFFITKKVLPKPDEACVC